MNLLRDEIQYLGFEIVQTMFHEFGHALNIALSKTKYQYLSGARGTLDMIEIPSHFTELFLTDYQFVKQFALVQHRKEIAKNVYEEKIEMKPISRNVFQKMLFCNQIFEFIELEESLYFTALDVEFHGFDSVDKISAESLLEINQKHLSQLTLNAKLSDLGVGQGLNPI